MVKVAEDRSSWTEADKKWGYQFGVDGVMDVKTASAFLGNISHDTLSRYAANGWIRKGKLHGRVGFCTRSVKSWLSQREI